MNDHVAKNLTYIEAVADIDRGHWEEGRERRVTYLTAEERAEERSGGKGRDEGGMRERGREEERRVKGEVDYKYNNPLTFALSTAYPMRYQKNAMNVHVHSLKVVAGML